MKIQPKNRQHPYGISSIRHVHTSKLHWTWNCALVQMVAAVQSAMAFGLDTDAPPRAMAVAPPAHSHGPSTLGPPLFSSLTRLPAEDPRLQRTVGGGPADATMVAPMSNRTAREKLGKPYPFIAFAFMPFLIYSLTKRTCSLQPYHWFIWTS